MVMALLLSSNEADCLSSQHRKQHANLKDTQQLMRSLYRASGLVLRRIAAVKAGSSDGLHWVGSGSSGNRIAAIR